MASAGTGKTYRLSLEFISLLLRYQEDQEFHFSQIVVMTFTRKATAEIREKILDFLHDLAKGGDESPTIIASLEQHTKYKWKEGDQEYIKTILLPQILQRKDLLQVSTIDSFVANIFKSMIAPYLHITEFTIDNNSNQEIMPQLLDLIYSEQNFKKFEPLLKRLSIRTVEDTHSFINSLINNRWILDYYNPEMATGRFACMMKKTPTELKENQNVLWEIFKSSYLEIIKEFNTLIYKPQAKSWSKYLLKSYRDIIDIPESQEVDINYVFESLLAEPETVIKNISLFLKEPRRFQKNDKYQKEITKFEIELTDLNHALALFYITAEIIPNQKNIMKPWQNLCDQYDKLKFSQGKFTYNDITYYTYKHLDNEELSLIDGDKVTNLFYEQLVSQIKFLLIDEFQDTSSNQFSILLPIINDLKRDKSVSHNTNVSGVIIVGDPKQSIYGWRGGERGIMEIMPKKLDVKAEDLSQCYRSSRPVIDVINQVFTDQNFKNSLIYKDLYDEKGESGDALDEDERVLHTIEWNYSPVTAKNWDANKGEYNESNEEGGELFYWEYNSAKADHSDSNDDDDDDKTTSFDVFANQLQELNKKGKIKWGQSAVLVRTKDHANEIAKAFNQLGIPNNIESSSKLLEHKAVEILLAIIKFKLLRDRFSLLHVLRSDLVRLDSLTLTKILQLFHNQGYKIDKEREFNQLKLFPECAKLLDLVTGEYSSQAHFVQAVLDSYNFGRVCENEIDWKNIYTFLDLVISFEMGKFNSSSFNIFGFMEYCQDQLINNSEVLQEGLQLENSLSILTIHAAKGLGFKNVFLYSHLSNSSAPNPGDQFRFAYTYNDDYLTLKDFAMYSSSADEKVLKWTNSRGLMKKFQESKTVEAIDVLYVAMTRAEKRLGLFFNYSNKSKSFGEYMMNLKDESKVISQLIIAYKRFFENGDADESTDALTSLSYIRDPSLEQRKKQTQKKQEEELRENSHKNYLKEYLTNYLRPELEKQSRNWNMKKIYLEDRHQLLGTLAHEYLTYIKYGEEKEFPLAKSMVLKRFGSLLSHFEIHQVIERCHKFIQDNPEIYSKRWNHIFNEKSIFQDSEEFRIDRMMVDSKAKVVMIIDYKTGRIDNEEQVNHYINIISEIPFVKEQRYEVKGKFVKLWISENIKTIKD